MLMNHSETFVWMTTGSVTIAGGKFEIHPTESTTTSRMCNCGLEFKRFVSFFGTESLPNEEQTNEGETTAAKGHPNDDNARAILLSDFLCSSAGMNFQRVIDS